MGGTRKLTEKERGTEAKSVLSAGIKGQDALDIEMKRKIEQGVLPVPEDEEQRKRLGISKDFGRVTVGKKSLLSGSEKGIGGGVMTTKSLLK